MNQTLTNQASNPESIFSYAKQIGSVTYRVKAHFSTSSNESLEDKILRLIENDFGAGSATMATPQTVRLSERGSL
jgi:hypothetical protein